jgi:hypothetical protein
MPVLPANRVRSLPHFDPRTKRNYILRVIMNKLIPAAGFACQKAPTYGRRIRADLLTRMSQGVYRPRPNQCGNLGLWMINASVGMASSLGFRSARPQEGVIR